VVKVTQQLLIYVFNGDTEELAIILIVLLMLNNVYSCHHNKVIMRVRPVHLMSVHHVHIKMVPLIFRCIFYKYKQMFIIFLAQFPKRMPKYLV